MKTEDILIYGGLAFLGYKFFLEKKPAPLPVTTLPANYAPGAPISITPQPASNAVQSLINTGGTLITKLFPSTAAPAAAPVASSYTAPASLLQTLFPVTPLQPASTGLFSSPGIVQENTSSLFASNSPFTSDTQYLMTLEDDETDI